jgi:hypothetical protein
VLRTSLRMPVKVDMKHQGHRQPLPEGHTAMEHLTLASIRMLQGSRCTQAASFMVLETNLQRTARGIVKRRAPTMGAMRNIHLILLLTGTTLPMRMRTQLTLDLVTCSRALSRTTISLTQVSCLHICSQLCLSTIHGCTQAHRRRISPRRRAKPQHGLLTPPFHRRWL